MMRDVVKQCRRVLKPKGSAVFILQPNSKRLGQMRTWVWEFVVKAAKEWNLVQDAHWWAVNALPVSGNNRKIGLLRPSVKFCVWLGSPDCLRFQDRVLWQPSDDTLAQRRSDHALRSQPSGTTVRKGKVASVSDERGGTTPFNLLPIPAGTDRSDTGDHPTTTPWLLADSWVRYLLPSGGVLLDPFAGSGTMLVAGLDSGAKKVIGIDRDAKFLKTARKRIATE